MRAIDLITLIILIIGGLNWGLIGLFDYNLVGTIFSSVPAIVKAIYILVGVSALWQLIPLSRMLSR